MQSFDPVSPQGLSISNLFVFELVVSFGLLALVLTVLVIALVRFSARSDVAMEPVQVHGNRRLELIWTITPAVVLGVVFVLMVQSMRTVSAQPSNALPVRVVGHQWWWEYQYPSGPSATANELHVPVGTPLQVSLESVDVIHSFHVPRFGWMQDAVPGKTNSMSILVDRAGMFDGGCNQYCGLQHAWMRIQVIAEPADQFNVWLQRESQPAASSGAPGEQVFLRNTCVSCHTVRGLSGASGSVGPDLTHLGSRRTLGAGVADNTPTNLKSWIRDAGGIKPGVLMPAFGNLSDSDLDALVDYLEGLK